MNDPLPIITLENYYVRNGDYDMASHYKHKCLEYDGGNIEAEALIATLNAKKLANELARGSNTALSTQTFKLNVNCFENLFDWLPLADLRKLRGTCIPFKHDVDHYIESKYTKRMNVEKHKLEYFLKLIAMVLH